MARFRSNLIANVAGAGWTAALQLICIPIFLRLLGVEGYGLFGFYIALQLSLQVLDLGFSLTINRELARYTAGSQDATKVRDVVRTLEILYWCIGFGIATGLLLLAPAIGAHWIRATTLDPTDVVRAVQLMALAMVFQWPLSFYHNGLGGLQQQVLASVVRMLVAGFSYGGAVVVLTHVGRSVTAFFVWQLLASIVQAALVAGAFWHSMPQSPRRPRFNFALTHNIRSFASGMGAIAVLGTILTQMDKIVLSRLLTLEDFGYYILGGVIASGLQVFISPIFTAVFPRLSGMVAKNEAHDIRTLYHQGTQLTAVLVLPMAVVLGMFGPQIVTLWTGDAAIASQVAPVVTLLALGTAVNGLMHLPYALQLAHGWTSLSLRFSLIKAVVFLPFLWWAASSYGATGGAATWAALNLCYMLIGVPLTHRKLLRGDALRWFLFDVGHPLLWTLVVVSIYRAGVGTDSLGWNAGAEIFIGYLLAVLAALAATRDVRTAIAKSISEYKGLHA